MLNYKRQISVFESLIMIWDLCFAEYSRGTRGMWIKIHRQLFTLIRATKEWCKVAKN